MSGLRLDQCRTMETRQDRDVEPVLCCRGLDGKVPSARLAMKDKPLRYPSRLVESR